MTPGAQPPLQNHLKEFEGAKHVALQASVNVDQDNKLEGMRAMMMGMMTSFKKSHNVVANSML